VPGACVPHGATWCHCIWCSPLILPGAASLQSGYVDMDKLEEKAMEYRPKMIICGASAYPRDWDYKRFREIADKVRSRPRHCCTLRVAG
jgi:hypothetical protein